MPRRCAASAGGMARPWLSSLRSLRPHHSPIPPAQAFRQSWLRCERVKQRVITTGQPASEDIQHCNGENHARLNQHRNIVTDRNGLRTGRPVRHAHRVLTSSTTARSGTRTRRLPGSRKRSTSWPAAVAPGRHAARRRTREPALGFRQCPARPGPAPRPRYRQDRARDERPRPGTGRLRDQVRELELLTDRVQNLGDRRDAFEAMRDLAAEGYRTETGDTWRPRNGSHSSQTGKLTSAAIDARDYLRAREGPRDLRASARRHPGRLHRRKGLRRRHRYLALPRQHQDQVRRYGPAARRRTRRGEDRGKLGGEERRSPGRLQTRLGSRRQGRALPAKRCPAELPAEGPRRLSLDRASPTI